MSLMAIDQWGQTYHDIGPHPRKWLLDYFGRKSTNKIYCDTKDGGHRHVGYVVAGHWCQVYEVQQWRK